MVQLPWSGFFIKFKSTKFLRSSLRVNWMWIKRNDHDGKKLKNQVWPFSCLYLSSSSLPQKKSLRNHYNNISLSWALFFFFFKPKHLFCRSHCITCWTVSVDNIGLKIFLLGASNFMVTWHFSPWCKPKWCRDKFNNQSQILHGLGMASWSMVWTTPYACIIYPHLS